MYPTTDLARSRELGRPVLMSMPDLIRAMVETQGAAIVAALERFDSYVGGTLRRVPGADTGSRVAHRLAMGATPEQAAAREYLYRWRLALDARPRNAAAVVGVPHTLGL